MNIELYSIKDFFEFLSTNSDSNKIYRGVKSENYKLIPKVGRIQSKEKKQLTIHQEKFIVDLFKQKSVPYMSTLPTNEIEWLALGQHYGLPTRLLDWTRNPLIATFFACEEEYEGDSLIYVFNNTSDLRIKNKDLSIFDPFSFNSDIMKYVPSHISERIRAQSGLFTIHRNIAKPYESPNIARYIIKNTLRKELKKHLYIYGINEEFVYPGLDGLCKHIEWLRTDKH